MRCREARKMMALFLGGELADVSAFGKHIDRCDRCRKALHGFQRAFENTVIGGVKEEAPVQPSPYLLARLNQRIDELESHTIRTWCSWSLDWVEYRRKLLVALCAGLLLLLSIALAAQIVKRQPHLNLPFQMKKPSEPIPAQPERTTKPVLPTGDRPKPQREALPVQELPELPTLETAAESVETGKEMALEPHTQAEEISAKMLPDGAEDVSAELWDAERVNAGKHLATVVQDPDDPRELSGSCRLFWLYIPYLHERRAYIDLGTDTVPELLQSGYVRDKAAAIIKNLVQSMNQYTAIKSYPGGPIGVHDSERIRAPWVYFIGFGGSYELSDSDLEALGRYMVQGGFLFVDTSALRKYSAASSHRRSLVAALQIQGIHADFERLPHSHPVYHSYFDFDGPPNAQDVLSKDPSQVTLAPYLEGLQADHRLAAVLSQKGYFVPWSLGNAQAQMRFGVNVIVFSLTQEGSFTDQLMDSSK